MVLIKVVKPTLVNLFIALSLVSQIAWAQSPSIPAQKSVSEMIPELRKFNLSAIHHDDAGVSFLFVGTRHTFDPKHPQIEGIEMLFNAFAPTLVLIEGGIWPIAASKEEAVRRYSELGFTAFLATKAKAMVLSADAEEAAEVAFALKHHPASDIRLYYALRYVPQWAKQESSLTIEQRMSNFLLSPEFARHFPADTPPRNIAELEALCATRLPGLLDWRTVQFDLSFNGIKQNALTEIDKTVSGFRNDHIEGALVRGVEQGERVFVIAGVTHLGKIVPRLQARFFQPPAKDAKSADQGNAKP